MRHNKVMRCYLMIVMDAKDDFLNANVDLHMFQ